MLVLPLSMTPRGRAQVGQRSNNRCLRDALLLLRIAGRGKAETVSYVTFV